ncbi:MAG: phospholipase D-like domain-containing protein [Desulfovibrio sp.]|jgi:cardiolipin synthase|nr:phospholipase D-like domain-containing protein [Desulfovibrio sp.]
MPLLVLETLIFLAVQVLSWAAVCHALLTKRDPRSALSWTVISLFLPVLGPMFYILFGISRAESRANRLMRRLAAAEPEYAHPPFPQEPPEQIPPHLLEMELPGRYLTSRHLCGGNDIIPLYNGDAAYPAMLDAVNHAQDHVYLASYIFKSGKICEAFIEAMSKAVGRGADVRVLIDGIGAFYSPSKPWKRMAGQGVHVEFFLPPRLFPPNFGINLRNHRKILICDNTAFTGGINIADHNCLCEYPKNGIQDVHFRCQGPIVQDLRRAFLLNWGFSTGKYDPLESDKTPVAGSSRCRLVMDGPGSHIEILNELFCGAISAAKGIIRIMTPYFLPSHDIMAALRSAARRGIEVWIVLPGKNNLPYMHWAMLRLLPTLLQAGVRIWLQPPPFAHSKLMTIDGNYSQIGSANLDARSLHLNFELNMEVFDTRLHDRLAEHIDTAIAKGREITLKEIEAQPLPVKLRNAACWIFSPYL